MYILKDYAYSKNRLAYRLVIFLKMPQKGEYMRINRQIRNISFYIIGVLMVFIIPIVIVKHFDKSSNGINLIKDFFVPEDSVGKAKSKIKLDTIKVNNKGEIMDIALEEYVVLVVAGEMPANFDEEALKAQSILARTFAITRKVSNCSEAKGGEICSTTHCQVFIPKEERMKSWGSKADEYYKKISAAVNATKGIVLSYDDKLAMHPQYFAVSSGKTEESVAAFSEDIPYLKSVDSPGEEIAPKYKVSKSFTVNNFVNTINSSYSNAKLKTGSYKNQINIISRNSGGTVKEIKLGGTTVKGTEFRKLLGLNSANFNITFNSKEVVITCLGYGHGVGLSQWGANAMAKSGKGYKEILEHYFEGCKLEDASKVEFDGKY